MKRVAHLGLLLLLCLASRTTDAKRRTSATDARYDFCQASVQALHCKLKVLVNGIPNENLSLSASHSSVSSAPLYRQDLKSQNTITLQVADADADTRVSLHVNGVATEGEIVSTDETGNIVALELHGKQIAAARARARNEECRSAIVRGRRDIAPKQARQLVEGGRHRRSPPTLHELETPHLSP